VSLTFLNSQKKLFGNMNPYLNSEKPVSRRWLDKGVMPLTLGIYRKTAIPVFSAKARASLVNPVFAKTPALFPSAAATPKISLRTWTPTGAA
jgi:hypothetical protein